MEPPSRTPAIASAGRPPALRAAQHLPAAGPRRVPARRARDVVPYLRGWAIGAVYTSPYFAAEPGTTHGYDVTNHNEMNREAGGAAAHTAFTDAVRDGRAAARRRLRAQSHGHQHGDQPVVARRAGERARARRRPRFFDIDWNSVQDGAAAQAAAADPRRSVRAGARARRARPPVREGSADAGLLRSPAADQRAPRAGAARAARSPAGRARRDPAAVQRRRPASRSSFDALHELLEAQAYRLAYWRTASHEINYRRFFDVNTLAGLRVEDPDGLRRDPSAAGAG